MSGTFDNSGTISAAVFGEAESAEATGLRVGSDLSQRLENSGMITAFAAATSSVSAIGLDLDGISGEFLNSGTISVSSVAESGEAYGYGLYSAGDVSGSLTNSGTVAASADAESYATIYGIYLSSGVSGELTNSGTITAFGVSQYSTAEAVGVSAIGTSAGVISNTGTIAAAATNSGSSEVGLYAVGANVSHLDTDGSFENSGIISAATDNVGSSSYASAYGVYVGDLDGTFSNTGTISATVNGVTNTSSAAVYGLYVGTFDGEITNAGTISVSGDAQDAYAIYLGGGTGTLNLSTDDDITGTISVAEHDVNLVADDSSTVFVFEDRDTATGVFDASVTNDTVAWFVEDEGGTAPIYAAVAAADIQLNNGSLAGIGALADGLSAGLPTGSAPEASRGHLSFDEGTPGFRPFVSANISTTEYDGVDQANAAEATIFDGTFGYAGQLASGLGVSVGAGVFSVDGSSGPNDYTSNGFFGGVTLGQDVGGFVLEGGVGFGAIGTENARGIDGSDDAEATIDSLFTTVHAGLSRGFAMDNGLSVTGFGQVRHTSLAVDEYEESGSIADATVDDYTTATTELKLGLEGAYAVGETGTVTGAVTYTSRVAGGDDDIDVTVFGATELLASTAADYSGAGAEIGYEMAFGTGGFLNIGLSQEFGDGATGPTAAAGISWSF
ncbi:autotransporter domain-containing protein [Yoonia sp. BS5-3]|uniref:Autotransporter domain-containing protein n=1 Tax=Yoonia phaeophyticola TaxID=3137369 RepID=A0ABZ2V829_9RHOB